MILFIFRYLSLSILNSFERLTNLNRLYCFSLSLNPPTPVPN